MKTNPLAAIARPITLASVALAALAFVSAANAQYKAVGDDGIAASPRVRQMLNERKASVTSRAAAAPAMACPKCADVKIVKVSPQAKGAEIMTGAKQVSFTHACAGCQTKLTVVGEGKAKHTVATHKCVADVPNPATCCASN